MNIENVKQIFGSPAIVSGQPATKKSNGFQIAAILTIGVIGYMIYREWKRKQENKIKEGN